MSPTLFYFFFFFTFIVWRRGFTKSPSLALNLQASLEPEIFLSVSQAADAASLCYSLSILNIYFCVLIHYKIDILSWLDIFSLLINAKLEHKIFIDKLSFYITISNDKHQKYIFTKNEESKVRK